MPLYRWSGRARSGEERAGTIDENFAKRQAPSFQTWQIETPQAAVALVLALVGLWLAVSGVRRLLAPA